VLAAGPELRRIEWDTWSGLFNSDVTAHVIILATAVTLHAAGISGINTAQAASALQPLAGDFAHEPLALRILGVDLIAVPVLAAAGAYALSEAVGWRQGLERKAVEARGFYGVIAASVLAGLVIQYSPISPMKALLWSAVINGIAAVPLMSVIIMLASKKPVMGAFTATRTLVNLGWIATAVMGAAAVRMFIPGVGRCADRPVEWPREPDARVPRRPAAARSSTDGSSRLAARSWCINHCAKCAAAQQLVTDLA
jgi:Mn2+/Fe2+ NRAMP family transporter